MTRTLLLVVVAAVASGCGMECDPAVDRPYCEGNVVVSCPEPGVDQLFGADRWVSHACLEGQTCVSPEPGVALCVAETSPSPLCAGERTSTCESNVSMVWCSRGYVTGRDTCTACSQSETRALCEGGFGASCSADSDCGAEHDCNEHGTCI